MMGKGVIISGGENGLYSVELKLYRDRIAHELEAINTRLEVLDAGIEDAREAVHYKQMELNEMGRATDALVQQWLTAIANGEEFDDTVEDDVGSANPGPLFALQNDVRAAHGLPALSLRAELVESAQSHANFMRNNDILTHTGSGGSSVRDRIVASGYPTGPGFIGAEDCAAGQLSAQAVIDGWMASPAHRANVLRAEVIHVGIGHAYSSSGTYRNFWVANYGRPAT